MIKRRVRKRSITGGDVGRSVDVICSKNIPNETKRLVDLLKQSIISGQFDVFSGVLSSQDGIVQDDPERSLTPDEIIKMDWLGRECDRKYSEDGGTERAGEAGNVSAGSQKRERADLKYENHGDSR